MRGILTAAVTGTAAEALTAYGSATRLDGLTVFDPFAGSGTTAVEALKLGASVIAWTSIRWPRSSVRLFSTHVFARHTHPHRVPAVHLVCPTCLDVVPGRFGSDGTVCRLGHRVQRRGAVTRGIMTCGYGHRSAVVDALAGQPPGLDMYAKLVLGPDGTKRYEPVTDFDRSLYAECTALLVAREKELVSPVGELRAGQHTRQAIRWGFHTWRQFFNDRQLYSLGLLASAVRAVDAGPAEKEALTALFSGTLEFNNMFCSFKGEGTGAVRHMFSHHILDAVPQPPAARARIQTVAAGPDRRPESQQRRWHDTGVGGLSRSLHATVVHGWPHAGLAPDTVYLRTGDSARTDLPDGSVDLGTGDVRSVVRGHVLATYTVDPPGCDLTALAALADGLAAAAADSFGGRGADTTLVDDEVGEVLRGEGGRDNEQAQHDDHQHEPGVQDIHGEPSGR